MDNTQLYYDDVVNVVFDNYGKTHDVKEAKGNWKYINLDNSKVSISKLPTKPLIRNFDDVYYRYVFCGWHQKYPCVVIDYLVFMKHNRKKLNYKQYEKSNRKR
jgi:hypothetical protein